MYRGIVLNGIGILNRQNTNVTNLYDTNVRYFCYTSVSVRKQVIFSETFDSVLCTEILNRKLTLTRLISTLSPSYHIDSVLIRILPS